MREILFRAKSVWGNWCEGYLVKMPKYFRISTRDDLISFGVDAETIGQFTGLTDKNGKRIFEGDIVKIDGHLKTVDGLYCVKYETANHCWGLERSAEHYFHHFTFSDLNGFAATSSVVGNIHDNPELLGGRP